MAKQKQAQTAEETIALGHLQLDSKTLAALVPGEYSPNGAYAKTGVILVNDRVKVFIPWGELPCTYTLSLYVQRDPINDDESKAVASLKQEREAAADKREREDEDRLAREKKTAFDLGQSSTMGMLANIGQLAQAAQALAKLSK